MDCGSGRDTLNLCNLLLVPTEIQSKSQRGNLCPAPLGTDRAVEITRAIRSATWYLTHSLSVCTVHLSILSCKKVYMEYPTASTGCTLLRLWRHPLSLSLSLSLPSTLTLPVPGTKIFPKFWTGTEEEKKTPEDSWWGGACGLLNFLGYKHGIDCPGDKC
jgi:hypothetical protein